MHRAAITKPVEDTDNAEGPAPRGLLFAVADALETAPLTTTVGAASDDQGVWWTEAAGDDLARPDATASLLRASAAPYEGEIDALQILKDRPDVFAEYFRAFFGPGNDRNSPAWLERVGGYGPEAYARYWYETYGRAEGYAPSPVPQGAATGSAPETPVGRTTFDGVPLSRILEDRPDVFRAFFTEYYGPNNDRNSDAWVQRVGGTTPEDYANYWYNAHGRAEGYVPSRAPSQSDEPVGSPGPSASPPENPALVVEDPSLDPWNHPAIFPDWVPPHDGWVAPDGSVWTLPVPPASEPIGTNAVSLARPLVIQAREDGFDLVPASDEEIARLNTLFDDTAL